VKTEDVLLGIVGVGLGWISWRRRRLTQPPRFTAPWQWGTHGWQAGALGIVLMAFGMTFIVYGLAT
jgi:hypothetical protein